MNVRSHAQSFLCCRINLVIIFKVCARVVCLHGTSPISIGRSAKVGRSCECSHARGPRDALRDCCAPCFPRRFNVTRFSVRWALHCPQPCWSREARGLPSPSCGACRWHLPGHRPRCVPTAHAPAPAIQAAFPGTLHPLLSRPRGLCTCSSVCPERPPHSLAVALDPSAAPQALLPGSPLCPRLGQAPSVHLPFLPSTCPC